MVDIFIRDITEGIADTGVRAAILKCAVDAKGLTDGVARVMRAVARAHRRTGAPITIHTHPGSQSGLDVRRCLRRKGRGPARVVWATRVTQ